MTLNEDMDHFRILANKDEHTKMDEQSLCFIERWNRE